MKTLATDVVIAGGGMVGAAFSLSLAAKGISSVVVEPQAPPAVSSDLGIGLRVSALSIASEALLRRVHAWDDMAAVRVFPFESMHVWDAGGHGKVDFQAADVGEPHLGHIVENDVTVSALWRALAREHRVTVQSPASVIHFETTSNSVKVTLDNGVTVSGKLLVAADGARSAIREQAGIAVESAGYGQRGLVAVLETEHSNQQTARQRFLPGGPLALLPLDAQRVSIVWSLPDEECERLLQVEPDEFCTELERACESVLGHMRLQGTRAAFPLMRQHATRYLADRVALIGDAAHVVHPLAGQGVNLGLLDAVALSDILVAARADERDIGAHAVLRRYERARRGENALMLQLMDGFQQVFSNDREWLATLRNAGFRVFDAATPLKHAVMRRAMGIA